MDFQTVKQAYGVSGQCAKEQYKKKNILHFLKECFDSISKVLVEEAMNASRLSITFV
jgi:predicted secreted protein